MTIIRKWSGNGLTARPLTTSTAGTGDNPPSVIIGSGQTVVASGSRSPQIQLAQPAGVPCAVQWTFPSQAQGAFRFYWTSPSGPPATSFPVIRLRNGNAGYALTLNLMISGNMRLLRSGGVEADVTGNNGIAWNTRYRVEGIIVHATGSAEVRFYLGEATTPVQVLSATGVDFETAHDRVILGNENTSPQVGTMTYDDIAIADNAAFIGSASVSSAAALSGTGTLAAVISTAPRQAAAFSGGGVLVAGGGTQGNLVRKWSGTGLVAGPLTTSSAGATDDPPSSLVGQGQTIAANGTRGPHIVFTQPAGFASGAVWSFPSQSQGAFRFYWTSPTFWAEAPVTIGRLRLSGSPILSLSVTPEGRMRLLNESGTELVTTADNAVPRSNRLRVEGVITQGAGSVGSTEVRVYLGESRIPEFTLAVSAVDLGTAHTELLIGNPATTPQIGAMTYDDIAVTSTPGFIGPAVVAGAFALSGTGSLNVAGTGTVPTAGIIRRWSGDGLASGPLTTASAGTGDNAPSSLLGTGQTISNTGVRAPRIRLNKVDTTSASGVVWTFTPQSEGSFRFYWTPPAAAPASDIQIARVKTGASTVLTLNLMVSGNFRVLGTGGVILASTGNGGIEFNAGTLYRFEGTLLHNGASGQVAVKVFIGESTTPIHDLTATADLSSSHESFQIGTDAAAGPANDAYYDDIVVGSHAVFIGPFQEGVSGNPPVVSAGADVTEAEPGEEVTLTGTAVPSPGRSIAGLTWAQKDGPPVVLVGAAGGVGEVTIGDQPVTLSDPDPTDHITENSGLVASQQYGTSTDPILYGHNDSGGAPEVYAFDTRSGNGLLGIYTLEGATNGDWEDIAVGPGPDATKSYIYVGNIGSAGGTKRIYRFAEPAVAHGQALNETTIPLTGDAPTDPEPPPPEEPPGTNPQVTAVSASPTNLFDPDSGDASPTFYTISGLVVSKNPAGERILWGLNDNGAGSSGGGDPAIHAFTDSGSQRRILASYTLGGTFNGAGGDWEDMATGPGPVPGQRYLYIANVGAQGSSDTNLKIYRVAEPNVTAGQSKVTATIPASEVDTFTFSRPDDTRDCEAIICDPITGDLFYFEKRSYSSTVPKPYYSRVYRCPASQLGAGSRNITWTLVATIVGSTVDQTNTASLVSADISEDGSAIAVATYQGIWVYNRAVGQTVAQALNGTPVYRNLSSWGTETLAFDRGIRPARLYGMTEGTNTTLKYLTATWTSPAGLERRAGATSTGGYDVFTYTGGPDPDCESMFVDPRTGDLFLISKRSNTSARPLTSQVWRIPRSQMPSGNRDVTPELVGEIQTNRASTNNGTATAADISADGRWVVVCNYQEIFMWERGDTQTIAEMFAAAPISPYYQGYIPTGTGSSAWGSESIAFAPGLNPGRLYTLGESVGTSSVKYVPLTIESDPGAVTFRAPWVMGPRNVVLELTAIDSAGATGTDDITVSIIGHPLWYRLPENRWVPLRSSIEPTEPEPNVDPTIVLTKTEADASAVLAWTVTPGNGTVDGVYAGHLGGPGLNPWESDFRPGLEGTQNFGRLTNGVTYTLYVDVVVDGTRAKRFTTTVTPTAGVVLPTAELVATPSNGGATLAWTITPGSAAVEGAYAGHLGPNPAPFEGPFRAGATGTQSFTGLTNGSTYNLYVDAVVGGARVRRFATTVVPVATALPTVSVTATPGDRTVTLSWTIAANGNTVQGAYVGHTGPTPFESPLRAGLSGTQVISALTNGTPYTFYVDVVVGGARVTRRTVTATPVAAPTGLRRAYGIYNGDWGDEETLAAFGRYPDMASGYIQGEYQGWNQNNANLRADRGINGFYTITTKIFPTRIYDLATPGAAGSAQRTRHNEAIAWVQAFADRCNIAANRNPNNQTIYATLEHEHDVKWNQGVLTGQSADPAVYGKALTHFIQIFRDRAPRVKTGFWYGGFQTAHVTTVWANIGRGLDGQFINGFTMDFACMDPYVNEIAWSSLLQNLQGRVNEVRNTRYREDWLRLGQPAVGIGEHGISKFHPQSGTARHSDAAMADYHYGKPNRTTPNPTTTAISARRVMIDLDLEFMMFFNRDSGPQGRHKVNDGSHPLAVAAVAHSLRPL